MASLSEVYERKQGGGGHASPRRVFLGGGLFILGAAMVVVGLVLASTEILAAIDIGRYESRRIAGVLGGIGLPAVFVGILTVLPGSARLRATAALGAAIAIVGVALFWSVYPGQWLGAGVERHYTFETATIYFLGMLVTFWCFFVSVANFKTRNDPGGTVELEVTTAGRTRIIEVDRSAVKSGLGGIGFFGGPTGTTEPTTVSDGGSTTQTIQSTSNDYDPSQGDVGVDVITAERERVPPIDEYCGNCAHFRYIREGGNITPYCGYHSEAMDDMQPCDAWSPSSED